eukprot:3856145-Alexandrium_andersonii.AAC.1
MARRPPSGTFSSSTTTSTSCRATMRGAGCRSQIARPRRGPGVTTRAHRSKPGRESSSLRVPPLPSPPRCMAPPRPGPRRRLGAPWLLRSRT